MDSNFLRSLSAGNKAEAMLQTIFATHGVQTEQTTGKEQYDILAKLPSQEVKLEVKYDIRCARSGNIAIEFYNPKSGRPSGIGSTIADLWVHIITKPLSVYITSVPLLKAYVSSIPPHRLVDCGGDDNSSMYLYKAPAIFGHIFHRIDESPKDEFLQIVSSLLSITDPHQEVIARVRGGV